MAYGRRGRRIVHNDAHNLGIVLVDLEQEEELIPLTAPPSRANQNVQGITIFKQVARNDDESMEQEKEWWN